MILPFIIILTNTVLIIGLRRRSYQRRYQLGTNKKDDWKERSVILYMFLSSIVFVILTTPIGILGILATIHGKQVPTDNLSFVFDLMEIVHHCSHFPILLMTSSMIRKNLFHTGLQRQKLICRKQPIRPSFYKQKLNQQGTFHPHLTSLSTGS